MFSVFFGAAGDGFGVSIAVSGDTAIIGAYEDDISANNFQGSAYVFVRNGATWTKQQKLTASDGALYDRFGYSGAISGDTAIIAAVTDVSVFRPSAGTWYLNQSTSGFSGTACGTSTDKIVPADYDGDGKLDVDVFRNGSRYLNRSTQGFTGVALGASTDTPVPNAFVR